MIEIRKNSRNSTRFEKNRHYLHNTALFLSWLAKNAISWQARRKRGRGRGGGGRAPNNFQRLLRKFTVIFVNRV